MSRRSWIGLFIFIVVALFFLSACGAAPEASDPAALIVGKWRGTDASGATGTIAFFKDGTARIDNAAVGNYTILDGTQIRLEGSGGTTVFTYELAGDTLTLSSDGDRVVFQRVDE